MTEQKKLKIKESLNKTRLKRSSQQCHVYTVKIQYNKLSKLQQQQLKMLFVQSKWLYNDVLNYCKLDPLNKPSNYKLTHKVTIKNKDDQFEQRQLKYLAAQSQQSLIQSMISSIKTLSTLKKNGYNIGPLKFKSEYNVVNLKQYGCSHKLNKSKTKIKIQGIKGYLKVNGLQQLKDYQIANAKLLNKPTGYYLAITTFRQKQIKDNSNKPSIGIDFGCTNSFTLSNGQIYSYSIKETERLKRLQTKLVSKKKNSNNRNKIILKIRRQYEHINNRKQDITNKFIHYLVNNYSQIAIQDQQLNNWKQNGHGKAVQHSILGRVKSKLITNKVNVINKYIPTTKTCSNCGYKQQISLFERIYKCPQCGLEINRDINSAMNILNSSPMEHRLNACNTRSSQSLD